MFGVELTQFDVGPTLVSTASSKSVDVHYFLVVEPQDEVSISVTVKVERYFEPFTERNLHVCIFDETQHLSSIRVVGVSRVISQFTGV